MACCRYACQLFGGQLLNSSQSDEKNDNHETNAEIKREQHAMLAKGQEQHVSQIWTHLISV